QVVDAREQSLEAAQVAADAARARLGLVHANHRVASQAVIGLESALARRRGELADSTRIESDQTLQVHLQACAAEKQARESSLASLERQLADFSSETVETLLLNARASCDRAAHELALQEKKRAVLEDRLT